MTQSMRRSRMTRVRSGKRIEITPRDIAIFRLLERYRYLRSTFIHAFVGGTSLRRFKERMTLLFHEAFLDRPNQQWQMAHCLHTPAIYELGAGARRVLDELGEQKAAAITPLGTNAHRQFQHALLICDIMASIELEIRSDPSKRLIAWREIMSKAPNRGTCDQGPRWKAEIRDARTGNKAELAVVPDAVFGIAYKRDGKSVYRFFALEADRATMPVTRSELEQSSFLRKLLGYRDIVDRRMHTTSFGLPNLLVLTITKNERHMTEMLNALAGRMGETNMFLFKSVCDFREYEECRAPMIGVVAKPWRRASELSLSIAD